MTTAITTNENKSPAELILEAVKGNADLSKLEGLLNLQKDWEAYQAKKLYAKDFASVQSEIEAVTKNLTNPQTKSKYADLAAVIQSAKPIYTRHGFSVIFYEGVTPHTEHVRICADVLHNAGHKETYFYDIPLDGKGLQGNANMTKIHGKASSVSYGRRYLMCMIWNIPTEDNDGTQVKTSENIDDKDLHRLRDHIIAEGLTETKVCDFLKVPSLEKLPKSELQRAMAIKRKK